MIVALQLGIAVFVGAVACFFARLHVVTGLAVFGLCGAGALAIELSSPWAPGVTWFDPWHAAKFHLLVAAVVGLGAALQKRNGGGGWVAGPLLLAVVGGALASTSAPPPVLEFPPGVIDRDGVVRQTTRMSCAPAAVATLLRLRGLDPEAQEADLAARCETDPETGTKDGDLVRGVTRAGYPVRIVRSNLASLRQREEPCVVFVGLSRERAPSAELFRVLRDECGWQVGEAHTVVCLGFAPGEPGEDSEVVRVADPRTGIERWGIGHFKALWDRRVLELREPD